ncbi:MAG: type II toxin-antitoxin system prevent-host-death family antitoxin [Phycisphaeraceae bacterium]|nr:type II toxin-antitoxin system prevent-host-death family antitoxin [Phycisphaeraceae bacterium]
MLSSWERAMRRMSITEVRRHFGSVLAAAKRGESTLITRRGVPVARIMPVESEYQPPLPDLTAFRASIARRDKRRSKR